MKYYTELMDKLFSDQTPEEFKDKVSEKISEAKNTGSAELQDGKENLKFTSKEGNVEIEDKNTGETTVASESPDGGVDLKPKTEKMSATQPDVIVTKPEGEDGEHLPEGSTENDVKVTIEQGIVDPKAAGLGAGKCYSLCIHGFESEDEANEFFSELVDEGITFSDAELFEIADQMNELRCMSERLIGTGDIDLAEDLLDSSESIRAYSILAENNGIDMSDVIEACESYSDMAEDMISESMDNTEIQSFFSELDEDDVTAIFSDLDEVESQVLYSILSDDEYEDLTFSDYDDLVNQAYSDYELSQSITEYFSEMDEDELDAFFSELDDEVIDTIYSAMELEEEGEVVTFSDVNDAIADMNALDTPADVVFSEASEDEIDSLFSELTDVEQDAVFSVLEDNEDATFSDINNELELRSQLADQSVTEVFSELDEESIELFSDTLSDVEYALFSEVLESEDSDITFSDVFEMVAEYNDAVRSFSDEDANQVKSNADEVQKAAADCEKTKDPELAQKVKVLAEKTMEDAEIGEKAGYDMSDAKGKAVDAAEKAAKVADEVEFKSLDKNQDGRVSLDEWKAAGKDEETFKAIDSNGDGYISEEEFKAADKDGNGKLSEEELRSITKKTEPKLAQKENCSGGDCKNYSLYNYPTGEQRIFSQGVERKSTVNPCLNVKFQ